MKKCVLVMLCMTVGLLVPDLLLAQSSGIANEIKSLQDVLKQLYDDMIPECAKLIGVGRGIAGFAATWYIGSRIWRHIANAEPIDFYPLLRPFALGFAIINFSMTINMIRGVLETTVTGTEAMVTNSNEAVANLLKQKKML